MVTTRLKPLANTVLADDSANCVSVLKYLCRLTTMEVTASRLSVLPPSFRPTSATRLPAAYAETLTLANTKSFAHAYSSASTTPASRRAWCCDSCLAAASTISSVKMIGAKLMELRPERPAAAFIFALAIESSSSRCHHGRSTIEEA
eukprot:COSAG04_NODE_123_length_24709_cov_113.457294_11_plen_147_part_00